MLIGALKKIYIMKIKIIGGLLMAGVLVGQTAFTQTDTTRKNRNPKDTSWKKNPRDTNWHPNPHDTFSKNQLILCGSRREEIQWIIARVRCLL